VTTETARQRQDPTPRRLVLAATLSVVALVPSGTAATAITPAEAERESLCALLAQSTPRLPLDAPPADRLAQLAVQLDGGIQPGIATMAAPRGALDGPSRRTTLGLLRRWRNSAQLALRSPLPPARAVAVDAGTRQELAARISLNLASRTKVPCAFPGSGTRAKPALSSLLIAFERARLVPARRHAHLLASIARFRSAIEAARGNVPAEVIADAQQLADALQQRADASSKAQLRAARERLVVLTQPFLLRALAGSRARAHVAQVPGRPAPGLVPVPDLRNTSVDDAYATTRAARLHLVIPVRWIETTWIGAPGVWFQAPVPGTPVQRGTRVVVTLMGAAVGSPALPPPPLPTATVPELTGKGVLEAQAQVAGLGLAQQTTFEQLTAFAKGATLRANYVVGRQIPEAGATRSIGVPIPGGIRITPVRLSAVPRPTLLSGLGG